MITQERLRLAATKLRTTSMPLADLIPLLQQAADELDRAQQLPDVDALTGKIAGLLGDTYHCTRVWEAWHVGTMSEDDFEPVDESPTPREIAEEIHAMLAAAPQPVPLTDAQKQRIANETGAGHSLICLVESYINGITGKPNEQG